MSEHPLKPVSLKCDFFFSKLICSFTCSDMNLLILIISCHISAINMRLIATDFWLQMLTGCFQEDLNVRNDRELHPGYVSSPLSVSWAVSGQSLCGLQETIFFFPAAVGFRALRMFAPPGLHPRAVYLCQHSAGGENTRPKQAGYHGWPTVREEALQLLTDSYLRGGYYTAVNTLDSCVLISLCTATVWNKRTFF